MTKQAGVMTMILFGINIFYCLWGWLIQKNCMLLRRAALGARGSYAVSGVGHVSYFRELKHARF